MSDEQSNRPTGGQSSNEAWREVGKQFETLGVTLAEAVRTTWYSEENRKRLQEMQGGIESMVKEVNQAIEESSASPQGQQTRTQVRAAAETMRAAGEQTFQELRPHLVAALHQLNEELRKLVERLEANKPDDGPKNL